MALIYLDNAATSWPKAPGVSEAVAHFLDHVGANPGRSGHRLSIEAGRIVHAAREAAAELFGAPDPVRVLFTSNATEALNLALHGLLRPGDHVVASALEHNAVMRPLRALERDGVRVTTVACNRAGTLDPGMLAEAVRPETALIVLTHASNVTGALMPIVDAVQVARQRGVPLLVDAAQSAGAVPLDVERDGIDLLAFTGHKALYGPPGTGGLVLRSSFDSHRLRPLKQGGTGSRSQSEEQPDFLPDAFECGTLNAAGLAGLGAAVRWVLAQGAAQLGARSRARAGRLIEGLRGIPGVTLHGWAEGTPRTSVVSFTVAGCEPSEIGERLDAEHGILCRVGLHCAPAAHRAIGTFPTGTVRFSPGAFTTEGEIDRALAAVASLAGEARR